MFNFSGRGVQIGATYSGNEKAPPRKIICDGAFQLPHGLVFQKCTEKRPDKAHKAKNKDYHSIKIVVLIWSEWHDLNVRPLPPQARLEHFYGHFIFFQTFPLRQKWPFALSWHLVSGSSSRVYGRVCGRKNPLPIWCGQASWERIIFYKDQWSTDVVALAASAHQGRCIVTLLQQFVKSVCDKNLHRNRQRKSQEQSSPSWVCRCISTYMLEMIATTPKSYSQCCQEPLFDTQ